MTLQTLLNIIGEIGIRDRLINFSCAGSSIYQINDLTVVDYPILYTTPAGTHNVTPNYTSYELTLYYIDRLLEDNSNDVNIHSVGVEVLKNIINKIKAVEDVVEVEDEYDIILFTDTEKMKDRCSGAYATIKVSVLNNTICSI